MALICHQRNDCQSVCLSGILAREAPEDRPGLPLPHWTSEPAHPVLCWKRLSRGHTVSKLVFL